MSKADKSSKAKTKKHMKVSKKNKIIVTIAIILTLLVCFAYVAYQTGLPNKVLPGAKIIHTVDGKEKTVKRVSIVEMNYYFAITYNQYMSYGIIQDGMTLDDVYNPTTGQTYREMLWESAANSAQADYLMYEEAQKSGFKPQATDRYIEEQVETVRQSCKYMNQLRGTNMTADQYLQSTYGRGMTIQIYRKIMKRAAIIDEFRTYLQQNSLVPNDETVQKKYDENPDDITYARFQLYFVNANITEEMTDAEKTAALAEAEKTAKSITDNCKDPEEFQKRVLDTCTEEQKAAFEDGTRSTSMDGYTKEQITNASEEFAELCFANDTPANTTMVWEDREGDGYYAAMFEEKYVDEETTVAYRVIVLSNDDSTDYTATPEQKAAAIAELHKDAEEYKSQATTQDQFANLAKEYSQDSAFIAGGYYGSVTMSKSFQPVDKGDGSEPELSAEDKQLSDWLFDSSRKTGDMIIIDSDSSVKLYYFCDSTAAWMDSLRTEMVNENYSNWYTGVVSDASYSTVVNHGLIDFFS